jgi:molybdate transport system substrate-binding protein
MRDHLGMGRWGALLLALLLCACSRTRREGHDEEVTVAVAASLRVVMPELIAAFNAEHGRPKIALVYGSSGDLKKRVLDGAPIDAVLFAGSEPVDQLIEKGRVTASTRRVIAHNRLVLIGRKSGPRVRFQSLDALPEGERIAIGKPDSVPAGAYAKRALVALGSWERLSGRFVYAEDVGAVLAYARRGEVAAAIVYATEVQGIGDVDVLDEAKGPWAPRAEVVVGVVTDGPRRGPSSSFVEFLSSPAARAILRRRGFEPPVDD